MLSIINCIVVLNNSYINILGQIISCIRVVLERWSLTHVIYKQNLVHMI